MLVLLTQTFENIFAIINLNRSVKFDCSLIGWALFSSSVQILMTFQESLLCSSILRLGYPLLSCKGITWCPLLPNEVRWCLLPIWWRSLRSDWSGGRTLTEISRVWWGVGSWDWDSPHGLGPTIRTYRPTHWKLISSFIVRFFLLAINNPRAGNVHITGVVTLAVLSNIDVH